MEEFWFYIQLGLKHVLDINAYDHILFLIVLSVPFSFKEWKKILVLATIFTIAHCLSLTASVYKIIVINSEIIEFLIPVTIVITAVYNLYETILKKVKRNYIFQLITTMLFGFIHGFGFSNYFKMLITQEDEKLMPLLGFAAGIEISQTIIIFISLFFIYIIKSVLKAKQYIIVTVISLLIILITIPLLIKAFP